MENFSACLRASNIYIYISDIIFNGECFTPEIRNKAGMSALTIIQHIGRSPSQSNKASKGDKGT